MTTETLEILRDDSEAADEGATARGGEDEPQPVPDENELEPDFLDPPDEDEEELDGLFEAFRSPTPSPASSPAKSLGPARTKKGAERRSATALSGAVAGRASISSSTIGLLGVARGVAVGVALGVLRGVMLLGESNSFQRSRRRMVVEYLGGDDGAWE